MDVSTLKIKCLGASNTRITVSLDAEGNKVVHKDVNYPSLLQERLSCAVRNYGVSGTNITMEKSRCDSYCERMWGMDKDADLVIVQGEGNDANHNIPLGKPGDTDPSTYCGAIHAVITGIRKEFPDARILMLDGMRKARLRRTCDEYTHLDFHRAYVETVRLCGLEPISFFDDGMLDPHDKDSMPDGTHMSVNSCNHYADKVAAAVKSVFEQI